MYGRAHQGPGMTEPTQEKSDPIKVPDFSIRG